MKPKEALDYNPWNEMVLDTASTDGEANDT
jgi:hypothetical protein